ncbi:MAG: prolyl oligopeptidase family serine peptidase [Spirochaetes bacterium]|jgi:dipeptidyl aminopeptidase/acylaminoacyl peptidase|nr:prolyl oligopeptidase family serine peptidase [Spirochaetota bacterium]
MNSEHPFTFEDLMRVRRISAPSVHPQGRFVAFVLASHDTESNSVSRSIHLLDMETETYRELTPGEHNDTSPVWSPDGRNLAFVSDREDGEQLWLLPFQGGGEARRVTGGYGGVSAPVWAPDSRRMAFGRRVTFSRETANQIATESLSSEEQEQKRRALAFGLPNEKSSARISDALLYRHWNSWRMGDRSHLMLVDTQTGETVDLTPGPIDVPPISLGGAQDFVFSPTGDEVAYIMIPDEVVTFSTNNSLFVQKIDGLSAVGAARCISENEAMELEPRYSPDGRYISYLGAERPTYEADRLGLKVHDRSTHQTLNLTEDLDRSVSDYLWRSPEEILFLAQDRGYQSLYGVHAPGGQVQQYTSGIYQANLRGIDEHSVLVTRESVERAAHFVQLRLDTAQRPDLTVGPGTPDHYDQEAHVYPDLNAPVYENHATVPAEPFWFRGADEDWVHAFLLKPPAFDESATYPLLVLIHGGPQAAFADNFHFRWNAQVFASAGYVVLMMNPRGSTGYGQQFTDQISGDWSGRCYTDLMRGVYAALESYSFIDANRLAGAGASFGGYMINWIAGHTDRFNVLVSHDGIFNQESMSYTTDELWFDVWEHGGMPYENPETFRRQSPHLAAGNLSTPMLVIQGERDYRCPVSEGISLFTALQARKVPSRLLYFPDEGHFVTQPANAETWYTSVLGFIAEHL